MKPEVAQALEIMGKGMAGIFIALAVIYVFIVTLTKLFPEKKESKEE